MATPSNERNLEVIEGLLSQNREVVHAARLSLRSQQVDPSAALLAVIAANVDNPDLSAEDFRALVKNSLAVVERH